MKKEKNINQEKITKDSDINKKELAMFIGDVVSSCYGVVGLTNVLNLKSAISILKREKFQEGVIVTENGNKYSVDVHIILAYGLKITEIINEISKRLSYFLEKNYGDIFKNINVYIEDVKVL